MVNEVKIDDGGCDKDKAKNLSSFFKSKMLIKVDYLIFKIKKNFNL